MISPRMTREQKRNCKLTDDQLLSIRDKKGSGSSYQEIAETYGVTPQAIYWVCLSEEERKKRTHDRKRTPDYRPDSARETRRYKKEIHKEAFTQYEREIAYKNRYNKDRPVELNVLSPSEKSRKAGLIGGAKTALKGSEYYRNIVNKRWGQFHKLHKPM